MLVGGHDGVAHVWRRNEDRNRWTSTSGVAARAQYVSAELLAALWCFWCLCGSQYAANSAARRADEHPPRAVATAL